MSMHSGALFAESFHIEVPSSDTDLLESGLLDSFQFVELLAQLERIARLVSVAAPREGSVKAAQPR